MSDPVATPPETPGAPAPSGTPGDTPASPGTPPATPEGTPPSDTPSSPGDKPPLPKDGPGSLVTGQPVKPGDIPAGPEGYEFKFQPDTVVDEELISEFRAYAHKKGLTNEAAGELAQFYEYAARKSVADAQAALVQQEADWRRQVEVDPEIGGPKLDENIAHATRAVEEFSTPELLHVLHTTG